MNIRGGIWVAGFYSAAALATPFTGELVAPSSLHSEIERGKKYAIELGFVYAHPSMTNIDRIVTENQDPTDPSDDVYTSFANDYPDVFAQTVKFQMRFDGSSRSALSVKTYLPLNSLSQFDTGYIYHPELPLYRSEAQRPRIQIGGGMDVADNLRLGLGADIGFAITGNVNVFLQSGAGRYSDQRIAAKLKPSIVPQASAQIGDYQLLIRAENKATMKVDADVGGRFFGGGAGIDFTYVTESALFFDPWSFEFYGKNALSGALTLTYGVAYQLWSRYQARAAIIADDIQNNCNGNPGCATVFARTQTPDFAARNLFVPQIGFELLQGDTKWEVGYRFKDSIFSRPPTGVGNYLDPPRHDFWLGATFPLSNGWEWGANVEVSRLVSQTVVKSNPTEIGGPGYTIAGWLAGASARIIMPF